MNTAAIKKFAPALRNQLMAAIAFKLDMVLGARTPDYLTTYAPQVAVLRERAAEDRGGLIERVAYTWFNRFTALRFIDAHGWHPFRARVLTPAAGETQPELLKLARTGALPDELRRHTDPARLSDLLDGRIPSTDAQGEVYRELVLAACRYYNALLPDIFERLNDETELLLPDDLLTEHAIVHGFRTEIRDDDCSDGQRANVELLGWLYQFYISERKDQVMARKSAVPTDDIPAVTQLFTPHWIVRYLVENSLGRLWLLNRPGSRLREHMPYYIKGEADTGFIKIAKPEDIRLLDPAAGSGHMLTYAFDLLTLIYEEEGYAPSEIPGLILKHNLTGLEICPRAAQLAELALVFKARERSRRFFQAGHLVRPNIIELRDIGFAENKLRDYVRAVGLGEIFSQPMLKLFHQFEEAKTFGSLIQPCLDERAIITARRVIEGKDVSGLLFLRDTHLKVLRVLEQAEALTQGYHVVVANPPYMGGGAINERMKEFLKSNFPNGKNDLFAAFMIRSISLLRDQGCYGMITFQNWMFISSFEGLRTTLLAGSSIIGLVHCGRGVWGADFGSCAFIISKGTQTRLGQFRRLFTHQGRVQTNDELSDNYLDYKTFPSFTVDSGQFSRIPGAPIAYWISERLVSTFEQPLLGAAAESGGRCKTHNDQRYVRYIWENGYSDVSPAGKWKMLAHGGDFRRWYGNRDRVFGWSQDARTDYASHGGLTDPSFWNREGVCWSAITISQNSYRLKPSDSEYSSASPTLFCVDARLTYSLLGYLNSIVATRLVAAINPSVNANVGDIQRLPFLGISAAAALAEGAVSLARADWDNFETSWDFRDLPLLRPGLKAATLAATWQNWETHCAAAIRRMQELETENNRLFIAAYGLEGELQPEVPEDQITLARADARRDMGAFLSYAVGCMMGRYSLDQPGLILANAGDTLRDYLDKVGRPLDQLTFAPDADGIVPVLDGDWFEDDIVARTREFLRATFGEATLRENLRFIEESLGKDLRRYFLTDFYKDHLQTYKKRPIYWMVQSPKKGFSVLVYLHRYTRDTMNLVLNRYLRAYQEKLRNRLTHLASVQAAASNARDKTEARKEADKIARTLHECEEWERQTVLPLAQARIELDLDDGVKVNYLKLGEALAAIPGLAAAEE